MPIMQTVKDFACTSVDRIELCITSKWSLKAPEDQEGTTPLAFRSGFLIFMASLWHKRSSGVDLSEDPAMPQDRRREKTAW